MKKLKRVLAVAGCLAAMSIGAGHVAAQGGRGNFDPAQMRERMLNGLREPMDVKDDAEWKVIADALGKVMDAQQAVNAGRVRGMGGGGQRRNRDNGGDNGGNNGDQGGQNRRRGGAGGFGGTPSPEAEALQKAIEAKAPSDEIKSKLAVLREANKASEAKLEQSQADLKKLLTSRQEAVVVLAGYLK
jgi:hypothetical protein